MICPKCGASKESRVLDSREQKGFTYRKRLCEKCGYKYFTHEKFVGECGSKNCEGKPKVVPWHILKDYDEAIWVETKAYGGNMLFPTAIHAIIGNGVQFENGQVRMIGLYGKQWRAWDKHPRRNDLWKRT